MRVKVSACRSLICGALWHLWPYLLFNRTPHAHTFAYLTRCTFKKCTTHKSMLNYRLITLTLPVIHLQLVQFVFWMSDYWYSIFVFNFISWHLLLTLNRWMYKKLLTAYPISCVLCVCNGKSIKSMWRPLLRI